jgi:hypothetical protein
VFSAFVLGKTLHADEEPATVVLAARPPVDVPIELQTLPAILFR